MNKPFESVTSESFLNLRKPSNQDDEEFIGSISRPYQAAKLRSSSARECNQFHAPVKFSWKAFWKTFIYENLPPVFLSPIAAIFFEKNLNRAWHVIQNRGLCALSTKHHPRSFIIQSWLFVYPGSWLMTIGLFLALFSDPSVIANIDPFHMILAYLLLFMRRLIISVKYGYFRPEDLERLCLPAPDWNNQKTVRKLIGQGWLRPYQFPGFLEDELTVAMDENDVCLQAIPLVMGSLQDELDITDVNSTLFPPQTSASNADEVTTGFILFNIIKSVYHQPVTKNLRLLLVAIVLALSTTTFIVKAAYALPIMGANLTEIIISMAILAGFINGFQIFMFGVICAIDYGRRFNTTKALGELIQFPGLLANSFLETSENSDRKIFIDLQKRANVFAWMNARKVLRSFGEAYYLRIQGYTSILVSYSLFSIGILNLIIWAGLRHHISTIFIIVVISIMVSTVSLFAIFKAIKLQSLSADHRDFMRNQLFIIEEEIWELKQGNIKEESLQDLQAAKALLVQVDESINYNELVYKPTTILGFPANNGVIGTIFGLLLTGVLFAIQGFATNGLSYDLLGWSRVLAGP